MVEVGVEVESVVESVVGVEVLVEVGVVVEVEVGVVVEVGVEVVVRVEVGKANAMTLRRATLRQRWRLLQGDSLNLLSHWPDNYFDSMVTDPPAGVSYMNKQWDSNKGGRDQWINWLSTIFAQCLRTLKPGAHALIWALPRTSGWTQRALEDAGFEVRDVITHLFLTGYPASVTLDEGVGTALKPAAEFWILARKPLQGTLAQTYETYGTGGLNVHAASPDKERWPANVALSHNEDCLYSKTVVTKPNPLFKEGYGTVEDRWSWKCTPGCVVAEADQKTNEVASRFFYCAKPARWEKDLGCEDLPFQTNEQLTNRKEGSAGINNPRAGAGRTSGGRNQHPTVKALSLMRYLVKLVTSQGTVLDPFAGSGSTGCAALLEGFRFIGFELDESYAKVARARLSYVRNNLEHVKELLKNDA